MNSEGHREAPGHGSGGLFGLRLLPMVDVLARWPVFVVRFEWLKVRQMYRSAKGPALTMIWTNLFWIIPILVYGQYAQVYALELGIKKVEIGYLAAVNMCAQVVFYLVGGWLTDRLGSLRCVLLFDTLSWPLPMAILAGASQPWHFYAAAVLAGTMTAVVPGWHAIFVSRVPADRRAAAYGLHAIVTNVPGLFFPLVGGWLLGRFGLELSMRCLYLTAAGLMVLGTALRWALIPQTPPAREHTPGAIETLRDQFGIYFRTAFRPGMRSFFLALALMNLDIAVTGAYLPVYFMKYLGLSEQHYALVSTAGCVVRLVGMVLVVPFIRVGNTKRFLVATSACWAAGTLVLITLLRHPEPPGLVSAVFGWSPEAPPRMYLLGAILAVNVIWAVGGAFWGPAIMAQWMNTIPEDIRSRLWGAHGAVTQVLAAGAVAVVGNLYALWCPALVVVEVAIEIGAVIFFALSPVGTSAPAEVKAEAAAK